MPDDFNMSYDEQGIVDKLPVAYIRFSRALGYPLSGISEGFLRLTKWTKTDIENIFSNKFTNMLNADLGDRMRFFNKVDIAMTVGGQTEDTILVNTKNGYRWMRIFLSRITDSEAVQACLFDITDIIEHEKSLENNQKEYRKITRALNNSFGTIFEVDLISGDVLIHSIDPYMRERIGLKEGNAYPYDIMCKNYIKKYVANDYVDELVQYDSCDKLRKVLAAMDSVECKYVENRDNVEQYILMRISGYKRNNGTVISAIIGFSDVDSETRREIQHKKQLSDAYAKAEQANKAKSAFLFSMSHDIRTPMNAIIGFTELASENIKDIDSVRKYLGYIQTSGNQLLDIINNILELARIENNRIEIQDDVVDMEQFGNDIAVVFRTEIQRKNISFQKNWNITHRYLYVDKVHYEEIFLNILSNAVKYTPDGGRISISATEYETENGVDIEFVVEDTGIGMSEEFIGHVYEDFVREYNTTASGIQGTGLGLGIVKRLVDLMKGTINISSRLGEGTKVTVRMPSRVATVNESYVEKTDVNESDIFKGKRILLAEDNELNTEIALAILNGMGFEVEHANDGIECVDMVEQAEEDYYDLILMDIQMPNMDGYKATRIIRRIDNLHKSAIPIFAMTANAFAEDRDRAIESGMNGHIAKPIDRKKLRATLRTLFEK